MSEDELETDAEQEDRIINGDPSKPRPRGILLGPAVAAVTAAFAHQLPSRSPWTSDRPPLPPTVPRDKFEHRVKLRPRRSRHRRRADACRRVQKASRKANR